MRKIELAKLDEVNKVEEIYKSARAFMKESGNPNQWGNNRPTKDDIILNINNHNLYVIKDDGKIVASFALFEGIDETYLKIDGAWLNDEPYVTIHSVAKNKEASGILKSIVDYAYSRCPNVRIDTHKDNLVMQKRILSCGFKYCGIIYLKNGDPRLAYQKIGQ